MDALTWPGELEVHLIVNNKKASVPSLIFSFPIGVYRLNMMSSTLSSAAQNPVTPPKTHWSSIALRMVRLPQGVTFLYLLLLNPLDRPLKLSMDIIASSQADSSSCKIGTTESVIHLRALTVRATFRRHQVPSPFEVNFARLK